MASTNFAALQPEKKIVWQRDVWQAAREQSFWTRFSGDDDNNFLQRITELTKTEKGEKVIMTLLADLVGDGFIGDDEREGNEEAMQTFYEELLIDLIGHSVVSKGKLAEQKSVVQFRKHGKNRLAYWLANRIDQLCFLTASGIGYQYNLDGTLRAENVFARLAFAADVSAPSAGRHVNWTGSILEQGNTANIAATYLPSYKMIVELIAYAKESYLPGVVADGKEYYGLLVRPGTLAKLKQDQDFQRAVTTAGPRGANNPWFTGAVTTVDGAVIHEHRYVYHNKKAAAGQRWGAGGNVAGTRTLLLGKQALGMADLGPAEWNEKDFQYGSKQGINVDKMLGILKPKFYSTHTKSVEDFGVLACDHYAG